MLDTLAITAAVLIVVGGLAYAYAATRPKSFRIARSVLVDASPAELHPLINDLRAMNTWNPFDKQDPAIKGIYSGPTAGVGATYAFQSAKAGTGQIEIVDSDAPSRVTLRLQMTKPIAADNQVDFLLEPAGAQTKVTWAMSGPTTLLTRLLPTWCMDSMCGGMFEKGLADLKSLAETRKAV